MKIEAIMLATAAKNGKAPHTIICGVNDSAKKISKIAHSANKYFLVLFIIMNLFILYISFPIRIFSFNIS